MNVLIFFLLLSFFGILFSLFVSTQFFFMAVFNFFISFIYSWKFKGKFFIGNLMDSWLGASSFIASGLIRGSIYNFSYPLLILSLIAFFGTLSREIFKDIEDIKGDKSANIKTILIVLGQKKAKLIGSIFGIIGCLIIIIPYYNTVFNNYYLIGAIPGILIALYAISNTNPEKTQKNLKISMLFVLIGFLISSISKI